MYKIIFFFSSHLTANSSQSVLTSKMLTQRTHKTNVQGAKNWCNDIRRYEDTFLTSV